MNLRNKAFSRNFWNVTAYNVPSQNRAVRVECSAATGEATYVYGLLHNHPIVKRCLSTGTVYVQTAGWPTRTTANAIRACLPPGWGLSNWILISPKGGYVGISDRNGWTAVIDPLEAYKAQNGW